jgi:hypothetical protein
MSIFRYLFDSDWRQRSDIEELRERTEFIAATTQSTGPSERWVRDISAEVKELAATVTVLMRTLANANLLDVAKLEAEVAEELEPKKKAAAKKERPPEPMIEVSCVRCATTGMSNEMVRVRLVLPPVRAQPVAIRTTCRRR